MIRIGVVNIDVSHPKAFATYLHQGERARFTAVYNDGFRRDAEVEAFRSEFGIPQRFTDLESMAREVDVAFIQGCNWDKHLAYAQTFLQNGKPVFIDKPVVGNLHDCLELERLAQEGHLIMGGSSVRYARELTSYLARPENDRGTILNIVGTSGVDEFNYAVHVVEGIARLIPDQKPVSVRFLGKTSADGVASEQFLVRYSNGTLATYQTAHGVWLPFHFLVTTTTGVHHLELETESLYGQLLDEICNQLESGTSKLVSVTKLTESIKVLLAGRVSREVPEHFGQEVAIDELKLEDPGFDGNRFEREYAAKAKPIYLR